MPCHANGVDAQCLRVGAVHAGRLEYTLVIGLSSAAIRTADVPERTIDLPADIVHPETLP